MTQATSTSYRSVDPARGQVLGTRDTAAEEALRAALLSVAEATVPAGS